MLAGGKQGEEMSTGISSWCLCLVLGCTVRMLGPPALAHGQLSSAKRTVF